MIIEEGIAKLNDRLKGIIYSRYYDNKTQMEIAEELGISQAQVSRLEKSALKNDFRFKRKINAILNSIFIFFSIIYKIKQMEDKDDV